MDPNHGDGGGTGSFQDTDDDNTRTEDDTGDDHGTGNATTGGESSTSDEHDGADGSSCGDAHTATGDDEEPAAKRPRFDTESGTAYTAFEDVDWPAGNGPSDMAR